VNPRRWLLLAGPAISGCAIVGLWLSARQTERSELDRANVALARTAAAYLSIVVPPGGANGYDPARLLSAVNNLARTSFWPGGLQLSLGAVPILPDTIGLVPVPDSLLRLLDEGRHEVIAPHAGARVALVPFLDRDRFGMLGWVAAWGGVRPHVPSLVAGILTALAAAGIVLTALAFAWEGGAGWRLVALVAALGFLAVLAADLGRSVHQTARTAAETRLLTLKRLIEVAATAPGVRQAMLPEIAVDVQVRPYREQITPATDVGWGHDQEGPTLTVVAATPRSQGGLELTLRQDTSRLARLRLVLAGWLALGAAGLGLAALGARPRGRGIEPARSPSPVPA